MLPLFANRVYIILVGVALALPAKSSWGRFVPVRLPQSCFTTFTTYIDRITGLRYSYSSRDFSSISGLAPKCPSCQSSSSACSSPRTATTGYGWLEGSPSVSATSIPSAKAYRTHRHVLTFPRASVLDIAQRRIIPMTASRYPCMSIGF